MTPQPHLRRPILEPHVVQVSVNAVPEREVPRIIRKLQVHVHRLPRLRLRGRVGRVKAQHGPRAEDALGDLGGEGVGDDVGEDEGGRRRRLLLDVARRGVEVAVHAAAWLSEEARGVLLHALVEGAEVRGRDGVGEGNEAVRVQGGERALQRVRAEGARGEFRIRQGQDDRAILGLGWCCSGHFLLEFDEDCRILLRRRRGAKRLHSPDPKDMFFCQLYCLTFFGVPCSSSLPEEFGSCMYGGDSWSWSFAWCVVFKGGDRRTCRRCRATILPSTPVLVFIRERLPLDDGACSLIQSMTARFLRNHEKFWVVDVESLE